MTYTLTRSQLSFGNGHVPFLYAELCESLPETIESSDDLDLEAIARDLNRYVFDRGYARSDCSAATAWKLRFSGTSPETADEMNANFAKLADDPTFSRMIDEGHVFRPTIIISGEGINLIYEAQS